MQAPDHIQSTSAGAQPSPSLCILIGEQACVNVDWDTLRNSCIPALCNKNTRHPLPFCGIVKSLSLPLVREMFPLSFNTRSFFSEDGKRLLKGGPKLQRGYFELIYPSMGKMIVNLDMKKRRTYFKINQSFLFKIPCVLQLMGGSTRDPSHMESIMKKLMSSGKMYWAWGE